MMSWTRPLRRWTGVGATVVFLTPLGACSMLGLGGVSTSHQELEGEWSDADVPGSVTEVAWEWVAEGHWGDVELTALPGGVLASTSRGVVALDGVTGEERWSFTVEDEDVRVLTDVSASGGRVHVLFPDEPQERTDVNDGAAEETGDEVGSDPVPARRVVLDGTTGEVIGDREEELPGNVEDLRGVFDVDVATDAGSLRVTSEPQLGAELRSDTDDEVLWRTEELFSCGESKVESARAPVKIPDAVVMRAVCGSGEVQVMALDPEDGSQLWSRTGSENDYLVPDGGVRRVGDLLAVYEKDTDPSAEGGTRNLERVVLDPTNGETLGNGPELGDGQALVKTLEDGYLVATRGNGERVYDYEKRGFDGETLAATVEEAIHTWAMSAYLLPLEEALIKLEPRSPLTRGTDVVRSALTVSGWGSGQETDEVALPRPLDDGLSTQDPSHAHDLLGDDRFLAVPGAVVLVDLSDSEGEGTKVIGFQ